MDIVINGGLLFLFAFSTVQTTHQDRPEQIWKEMTDSDLQVTFSSCQRSKPLPPCRTFPPLLHVDIILAAGSIAAVPG